MFTHIRTSKNNREVVAKLTRRLNLGTENYISRIALAHSLSKDRKLKIEDVQNSSVKNILSLFCLGNIYIII